MKSTHAAIALASAVALLPVAGAAASTGQAPPTTAPAPASSAPADRPPAALTVAAGTTDATATRSAPVAVTTSRATSTTGTASAAHPRAVTTRPRALPSHAASAAPRTVSTPSPAATTRSTPTGHPAPSAPRPRNDSYRGATVVADLPTTLREGVAAASLDRLETGLAQDCGLPTADRAVWFRYDDPDGAGFVVDASASDHPVAIALLSDPKANVLMGCSGGPVLTASPGPTGPFWVAVLSDTAQGATTVSVTFRAPATAPAAQATLDPTGTVASDGKVALSGRYSCAAGATGAIGGGLIQGTTSGIATPVDLTCDGTTHTWHLVVSGPTAFAVGSGEAAVDLSACSGTACSHPRASGTVTLSTQG
ncbi:DUF6299 family protein [Pedococcus sp. 2YAF34]|uniref:DUF6299 family protein n=1 Tax=Pedococcus sp. 2YAF34 TaxID=3233032 RepID=UPI003F9C5119